MSEKIDPYKNKERYLKWRDKMHTEPIQDISGFNSDIIKRFVFDMEIGLNVSNSSKKGHRSHIRLNNLIQRMIFIVKNIENIYSINKIIDIKELQIHEVFERMRDGRLKRKDGGVYKSVTDYIKVFKTFWHWYMKINRKDGKEVPDITVDLAMPKDKPRFVYFTEKEFKKLSERAGYEYRVFMWFLFDTGIRAPTELMNVKVSDLSEDCKELNIREEISKTFGRKIKLMLSPKLIKEYIESKELKPDDFLFKIIPSKTNQYLKRLGKKVFGDKMTLGGEKWSNLTMYDFRHNAACHWALIYKNESGLKYRFGWKKSDMIYYYTQLLGMQDTIQEEDLLTDITKTEIEKQLIEEQKKSSLMEEQLNVINQRLHALEQGLIQHATQQNAPIVLQTSMGEVASSVSGTQWQGESFQPYGIYKKEQKINPEY